MTTAMDRLRHRWFLWLNYTAHWREHLAGCPGRHAETVQGAPRCTQCGHRQPCCGEPPEATRELPAVLWPFEISGRAEAVIRGHLIRKGRLPQ